MKRGVTVAFGVIALVLAASLDATARADGACSCPAMDRSGVVWFGDDPSRPVPTNARVFVNGYGEAVWLEGPDGLRVPATILSEGVTAVFLVPDAPLEPTARYRLHAGPTDEVVAFIDTGTGPETAPAPELLAPVEEGEAADTGGLCDNAVGLVFRLPRTMVGALLRFEVETDGETQVRYVYNVWSTAAFTRLGVDECAGPYALDFLELGTTYNVRVTRIDAIGRESAPLLLTATAQRTAVGSWGGPNGCSIAAHGERPRAAVAMLVALLGITTLRRRRHNGR